MEHGISFIEIFVYFCCEKEFGSCKSLQAHQHCCMMIVLIIGFLGGLSLHLNHLIALGMTIYNWPFGTLPFRLFGSNLDTRDLETYPRTYTGHF